MFLVRKKASVATPARDAAQPSGDGVATSEVGLDRLRAAADEPRQLDRDVALLADELVWLKERFGKLQNRVTAELREIRREVDRLYEEELPDDDEGR